MLNVGQQVTAAIIITGRTALAHPSLFSTIPAVNQSLFFPVLHELV